MVSADAPRQFTMSDYGGIEVEDLLSRVPEPVPAISKSMASGRRFIWGRNVTIRTGLVDTSSTPTLVTLVQSRHMEAATFVTHHFTMDRFLDAYDVFGNAETGALKVIVTP